MLCSWMRVIGAFIFAVFLLTARAIADDDCTALLKQGLYNYTSTVTSNASASTFQSNFCQTYQRYQSDKVAGNVQASYGLFNGGASFSSAQIDALGTMLCTATYSNSQAQADLSTTSSVIDGGAVAAFTSCVQFNSQTNGLHVEPQVSTIDPTVVNLAVRYVSPPGPPGSATLQYVSYDRNLVTCTGDLVGNPSTTIGTAYRGMTCTRKLYATPQTYNLGAGPVPILAPPTTITVSTDAGQFAETVAAVAAAPQPPPSASIPLGGVIAWNRFRATDPIPDGYWIADGSTVMDPNSPYNGIPTPNLVDHFIMGVTVARIGENGGSNAIPMDGGQSVGYSGTTTDAHGNPDPFAPAGDRGSNRGGNSVDGEGHTHTFSGTISIAPHNHGGDKRPAYVGLLYLVRIR